MPDAALQALLDEQPHARAVLSGVADGSHELSHAYLITGPGGSGKRRLARALAAAALAAPAADGPIATTDVDEQLRRRVERDAHPDLAWTAPTSGAGILVEDVEQQILAAAGSTPLVASRRVFVIEQVETLSDAAANRLLKTIEEPPGFVHLLLLSDEPQRVLPTIASRCQPVRLDGLPLDEVVRRLVADGAPEAQARSAAGLAGADVTRARELIDAAGGEAARSAAEGFAAGLVGPARPGAGEAILAAARAADAAAQAAATALGDDALEHLEGRDRTSFERALAQRAKRAGRLARTDRLDGSLALVSAWLRDLWVLAIDAGETVLAVDRIDELHAALAQLAPTEEERRQAAPRLGAAMAEVERARSSLIVNPTEPLLLDALAIRLRALLAGDRTPA